MNRGAFKRQAEDDKGRSACVVVCASMDESLSYFSSPKRVPRGDKLERADSQTDRARGHPMRSCLSRLPSPFSLSLSFVYPHKDSDGLCFTGG